VNQTKNDMKTKLAILTAALLFGSFAASAHASDQRPVYNSKGQLIAVVRDSDKTASTRLAPSGPTRYIASPSGKGGAVTPVKNNGETSIALFKSKKKCC
jgi:hypothetical protein